MIQMVRVSLILILILGASFSSLSQVSQAIFFVDKSSSQIHDVIVLEWNGATWLSDLGGKATLPEDHLDSLVVHSMTFRDTVVNVTAGDTIILVEESSILSEVIVYDRTELEYIKHRRARYELQREPGEYYLLGYYAQGDIILDSLRLKVEEVHRNSTRFRIVIWEKETFVFESEVFSVPTDIEDENYTIPIDFHRAFNGEFYVGIQFLEVGRDPFGQTSHFYQYRGRGNVYTNRNTGITLGSIRLKPSEKMITGWWYNGRLDINFRQATKDYRPLAPYIGIHYFGSGELLTNFDDIED